MKSVGAKTTWPQSTPPARRASTLAACVGGSSTSKHLNASPLSLPPGARRSAPPGNGPYERVSQPAPRTTNCRIGLSAAAATTALSKKCVRWLMKVISVDGRGPGYDKNEPVKPLHLAARTRVSIISRRTRGDSAGRCGAILSAASSLRLVVWWSASRAMYGS